MQYNDRAEAGRELAAALEEFAGRDDVLVLGLPRGGVAVAAEVAGALNAPLDVLLVRKLGVPGHEELAAGAIAEDGVRVMNEDVVRTIQVPEDALEETAAREGRVLAERGERYRGGAQPLPVQGKCVLAVDDGLATGATMRAALDTLRARGPARTVVAVPVAPPETIDGLRDAADDIVCLQTPPDFGGIGKWYKDFTQVDDETVLNLLESASK